MAVDKQNFSMYAGDDIILSVGIKDEVGNALSLLGASLTWSLSRAPGEAVILTKTTGAGITVTDVSQGVLSIYITHADSVGFQGALWHQLVLTDASGDVTTVMTGQAVFKMRS